MTLPNTKYGVEIEFISLNKSATSLARLITDAGVPTAYMNYNHTTQSHWKIVTDGSLSSGGLEIVSPILQGESGFDQIKTVTRILIDNDCVVNYSCGLHVHVDAADMTITDIKAALAKYNQFDSTINQFVKAERATNTYCRPVSPVIQRISNINNTRDLKTFAGNMDRNDRYYKLNIASYYRHGTLEFRQHHGTLDANTIINWAKFCLYFTKKSEVSKMKHPDYFFYSTGARKVYNWLVDNNYTLKYDDFIAANNINLPVLRTWINAYRRDIKNDYNFREPLELKNRHGFGYYVPEQCIPHMHATTVASTSLNLFENMPKDLINHYKEKTF